MNFSDLSPLCNDRITNSIWKMGKIKFKNFSMAISFLRKSILNFNSVFTNVIKSPELFARGIVLVMCISCWTERRIYVKTTYRWVYFRTLHCWYKNSIPWLWYDGYGEDGTSCMPSVVNFTFLVSAATILQCVRIWPPQLLPNSSSFWMIS